VKDPEPYLRNQKIEVACVVYPSKKARIDSSIRRQLGHDLFYFSSAQAMKQFDRDPLKYVKVLSDPVSDERFKVTRSSLKEAYKNRTYYFADKGTLATFDGDREKYRDRRAAELIEGME
jgi:YHS domain-containing protein